MSILYVYLDHSGDYKFIPQASQYFTLASLCTWNPVDFALAHHTLRHKLIEIDNNFTWDCHRFHASEDPLWVRNPYIELIAGRTDIRVDTITVRKNRIFADYQPIHIFYPHMTKLLLKYVLPRVTSSNEHDRIEFIIDHLPIKQQDLKNTFEIKMDVQFKRLCPDLQYRVSYHYSHAHPHLQAVDYCAWAVFRRYEKGDTTKRDYLVRTIIKSEWEYATRSG